MKNKWLWPIVSFCVIALLLSFYSNSLKDSNNEQKFVPLSDDFASHQQETTEKLSILNNDINMSTALNKSEAYHDIMKLSHINSYKQAKLSLKQMMDEHPHFVYLNWQHEHERVQLGSIPKITSEEGKQILSDLTNELLHEDYYISPIIKAEDLAKYQIVAAKQDGVTTTVYIKQSVIPLVEQHQKNNLRIIPFPADNESANYETVKANSTEPIHVLTAEDNENASHYYEQEVVVKFKQQLTPEQIQLLEKSINGSVVFTLNSTYIFKSVDRKTPELIDYFRANHDLIYAEPHYIYITNTMDNNDESSTIIPNDSLFNEYQWNLSQISTPSGWNYSKGSDAVTIAILDTGANFTHPDLKGRLVEGYNTTTSTTNAEDDVGHGTHVTGIIGAQVDNKEGIAGISWYNKLLSVKVLNGNGYGSTYAVAQGIIWATDNGAKVINMSLGNYASADFLHEAIQYAYERDVVLIAATGNDNTDRPGYPAAYDEVLAVGATTSSRERAIFSNFGEYVDVVAPGDQIPSTYLNGQYAALSGTSMATPHVTALAGLIRSINPSLTNVQVIDIIKQTATDLGDGGHDIYFGYGEINVEKALALAASYNGTLQSYAKDFKAKLNKLIEKQ